MFIKDSISFTICTNLRLCLSNCEDLWIKQEQKHCKFIIGTIYRHPHQNMKLFHDKMEYTLDNLSRTKETYYIVGDTNVNFLKLVQHIEFDQKLR